jgi:hypothetical protein
LLLSGVPASATPRVTLRLERATFHEALQQLKQATGWDIRGPSGEGSEFYEEAPNPTRSSFDWREASLGKVCRDLGEAFRAVARYAGPSTLRFEARAPAPSGARLVAVTRTGVTLLAERVEIARILNLESAPSKPNQECRVRLAFRPTDGDPGRFHGLNQVRGMDNLGRAFTWDRTELLRPGAPTEGRPDEWAVEATLKGLDPRATRLTWLEGELLLYREVRRQRVEVPVAGAKLPHTRADGPVELVISELRQTAPGSVQLRVEESWPDVAEVSTTSHNNPNWPYPAVRLASGRLARMGGSANASLQDGRRRVVLTCAFEGNPADPPVAVVWDLLIKTQPDERLTLRLENIPLGAVAGGAAVAGAARGGAARPAVPPPPSGPGSLANRVLLEGQPGGEGELAVGLSVKKRDGTWDAVRWQVLDTDLTGSATLDGVAPGTYRVLRKFRPTERAVEPAGSVRWENDNVTIRVEPGRLVTLPPLSRVKK